MKREVVVLVSLSILLLASCSLPASQRLAIEPAGMVFAEIIAGECASNSIQTCNTSCSIVSVSRVVPCGAASGAITGCAQGVVCSFNIPQICLYGSCVAGFLGSVANDLCVSGSSLTDACSWFAAIMSGSMGCTSAHFADVGGWKEKLILIVLGGDVASWSSVCGD